MYGRGNALPTIFGQGIRIVCVAIGLSDPDPEIVRVRRRCECSPDVGHQCRAIESTERKISAINRRLYEFAAKQECRITDVCRQFVRWYQAQGNVGRYGRIVWVFDHCCRTDDMDVDAKIPFSTAHNLTEQTSCQAPSLYV